MYRVPEESLRHLNIVVFSSDFDKSFFDVEYHLKSVSMRQKIIGIEGSIFNWHKDHWNRRNIDRNHEPKTKLIWWHNAVFGISLRLL